jgi:hypothetical protein
MISRQHDEINLFMLGKILNLIRDTAAEDRGARGILAKMMVGEILQICRAPLDERAKLVVFRPKLTVVDYMESVENSTEAIDPYLDIRRC